MKKLLKNREGTGIVSVIVALVVILAIAASFYQAARMSSEFITRAENTNAKVMALVASYYGGGSVPEPPEAIAFTGDDGTFSITTSATAYEDAAAAEGVKLYYFGE